MTKIKLYDTELKPERAILVGVILPGTSDIQQREYLDELAFLVTTAGGITERYFTQRMQKPERATFVGTGKLEEIQPFVKAEEIDLVVFDDELSPMQLSFMGESRRLVNTRLKRELQVRLRYPTVAQGLVA